MPNKQPALYGHLRAKLPFQEPEIDIPIRIQRDLAADAG